MSYDLLMQTDAYHLAMGCLIDQPHSRETHVLYARHGGPQVVPNLALVIDRLVRSVPSRETIYQAAQFWADQRVPFDETPWLAIADRDTLPLSVRGVRDGEVVRPGEPIAIVEAPAFLASVIEPVLIGELMASMQVATRFIKAACAVGWDTSRLFEVGLRAAPSPAAHLQSLTVLARLGLVATSNGEAAARLGLKAVGTMGHRYTLRFTGQDADYQAFSHAIDAMRAYRREHAIRSRMPLSLLLDTRSTVERGLPAAIRVFEQYGPQIHDELTLSVRLDSGDLPALFETAVHELDSRFCRSSAQFPAIILESGLTASAVAELEHLRKRLGVPAAKVSYGLGGYLVGGLDRDAIALVYKLSGYDRTGVYQCVMKFGDEPAQAKRSYPGDVRPFERRDDLSVDRRVGLAEERTALAAEGFQDLFLPLVEDGRTVTPIADEAAVADFARTRWQKVARAYLGDDRYPSGLARRPVRTFRLQALEKALESESTDCRQAV